jgi:hypothetical protein
MSVANTWSLFMISGFAFVFPLCYFYVIKVHEDLIISPLIFQGEKSWFIELAAVNEDQADIEG